MRRRLNSPTDPTCQGAYWMPFTANRQFKARPGCSCRRSGMYYQSDDGRQVLDGTAGLWCVPTPAMGRPEIGRGRAAQLMSLDYAPSFQMGPSPGPSTSPAAVAKLAAEGLDRVFRQLRARRRPTRR
jgi:beta-alanine--pyruvate transaminase